VDLRGGNLVDLQGVQVVVLRWGDGGGGHCVVLRVGQCVDLRRGTMCEFTNKLKAIAGGAEDHALER
jgi:hypothetical protein